MTDARQELYDRIRETSRDEVILTEMVRLGFWPAGGEMPCDPAAELARRKELEGKLRALVTEQSRLQDVEALRKAIRQQRMKESRERRAANKQRRIEERAERRRQWQQRKQQEIIYLGAGVSAGLNETSADEESLTKRYLPALSRPEDVAKAMGISVGELRFLAFARRTSTLTHYQRFKIPKKTGGERLISAPMPRLKRAQRWILDNILHRVDLHEAAHGFRPGRSIVTNAQPHTKADVVVNLDLENFFPTVTYPRIKGVFRKLGYSESVATIFALLCSEPETDAVRLDGNTYYVAQGERYLPQGAPTSPAITNIICRGLDTRLNGLAKSLGFFYTRYADDLTFSGSGDTTDNVGRLLRRAKFIIADENFRVHPNKTRIFRKGRRQEVTGLVVNDRVNVSRNELRRFRAVLFQIEKDGPAGKRWGNGGNIMEAIEGFANFVAMVDPTKGKSLQQQVARLIEKHGRGPMNRPQRSRWQDAPPAGAEEVMVIDDGAVNRATDGIVTAEVVENKTPPDKPNKPWWKFW